MRSVLLVSIILLGFQVHAVKPKWKTPDWSNCGNGPQTEPILENFWKSASDSGNGPEYKLKSGQVFSNQAGLCRQGSAIQSEEWLTEAKKLNPEKSITTFREIRSAEEFLKLLKDAKIQVNDPKSLEQAVRDYFKGFSTDPTVNLAQNAAIFVGQSSKSMVILFGSNDVTHQYATFSKIQLKP